MNAINSYFGYRLINEIRLQSLNSENAKMKNKNKLGQFAKNFEGKIKAIKNKNIRNSLSQLLDIIKND